jgi:hypothetical protein
MDTAAARPPALQVFEDAFGTRHHADAPGGEPLEVLELREQFSAETFESMLRERVNLLAGFHSTWFAQVRTVQRINQSTSRLFVVFDRVHGARLSNVLSLAKEPEAPLDVNATLCLIRQLVAAIALLHEKLPHVAHGAISAERILITPKARLVVTDHVLASALEQLRYSPDRFWNELRIPVPNDLAPTIDQRTDVMQIGTLALELILGRPVARDEYPVRIHELTERAWADSAASGAKPLPAELRTWLLRMLQLDAEPSFGSAVEAWENLEQVLVGSDNRASFLALEGVMAEYARRVSAASATSPAGTSKRDSGPSRVAATATRVAPIESVTAPAPVAPPVASPAPAIEVPFDSWKKPLAEPGPESPAPSFAFDPPVAAAPVAPPAFEPAPITETKRTSSTSRRWIAAAAVLVLLTGGGAMFGRRYLMPPAAAEAPGTLVVNTNPAGYQVLVDGQPRGVTPLTLELAPGAHELRIETDGEPRIIPFTVAAGSTVAQTLELPKAAPSTGQLTIRTEPAGARVTIDGMPRGTTPLTVEGLAAGPHSVALANDLSTLTQDVVIEPGTTASLVVPMTAPQGVPVSGWISVSAPTEVEIYEDGRLLGSSQTDRIMVSAGGHSFEVVNAALGYRVTRSVTVAPGKVTPLRLEWPMGSLALNAQPWANVWVNGEPVGETPIGNVSVPIGTHEIVFRHPELGEQVVRTTVTATQPARVSVDLRKQ